MRLLRLLPIPMITLPIFVACSSSESRPPMLGSCVDDAGCSVAVPPGGGGGGGDDSGGLDAASCNVAPTASQCDQCAAGECCASLSACTSSSVCGQLLSCIFNCLTPSCVTMCDSAFPSAVQAYQVLESCLQVRCPICQESGVGDPCPLTSCVAGVTCQGLWCTKPCTKDADCAGIGPNGGNTIGRTNVCMATPSGPQCAPGCSVDADCASFPQTYCHSTQSFTGANVQVCAPVASVADASTD